MSSVMDMDMIIQEDAKEEEEFIECVTKVVLAAAETVKVVAKYVEVLCNNSIERPVKRRFISNIGHTYMERVLNNDPDAFRVLYRMYPDVFRKLCRILRDKAGVKDTRFVSVEEMVATFLLTVGQNSRYCQTRETFDRSKWTTSTNFNKILRGINIIGQDMMAKPSSMVPAKIRDSTRYFPYFKDCIGAIDGTHIPAIVKVADSSRYRNRHGTISQNVMAACNFDLEFIYVLSGWEGSAHDSRVLNDAMTPAKGFTVPKDKYYLVDCGYPIRPSFLAPFRGVRYHLQDFSGQGRHPENANELFNLRHASLRNTVERIFGIFKSRFTIFKSGPPFPFKTQAELVVACAALHNFLRKECRSDEFPIEDDEPNEVDDVDDEEETQNMTQAQQRVAAEGWRVGIATEMWNDAPPNQIGDNDQ